MHLFFLILSLFPNSKNESSPSYLKYLSHIEKSFIINAKNQYNLDCSATGGKMPYDIEEVGISFSIQRQLNLDEARFLEISLIEDFLNRINSNEEIRPFLREYPFTSKRVNISIACIDSQGKFYRTPLTYISNINGKIYYKIDVPKGTFIKVKEESFEEAQRLAHENPISMEVPQPTFREEIRNTWDQIKSLFTSP